MNRGRDIISSHTIESASERADTLSNVAISKLERESPF